MAHREGLQSGIRKQLGFAFKDISEHLPGAFIIYRADKDDDELFYANHEFLHMTGYNFMDELFRLTNKRFRNLILKDEQKQIESSIWEQMIVVMKMTIFTFTSEKMTAPIFLSSITEES